MLLGGKAALSGATSKLIPTEGRRDGEGPSQSTAGCFGSGACLSFREIGVPAGSLLPVGTMKNIKLQSTFCMPQTTNALLVNFATRLPDLARCPWSGT